MGKYIVVEVLIGKYPEPTETYIGSKPVNPFLPNPDETR